MTPRRAAPEADATRELYERYARQIYTYCLHQLGNKEEAEDAMQSTFLNAFRGFKRGVDPEFESAWLYKIAQNVCLTRQRSSSRRRRVESPGDLDAMQDVLPSPAVDPDELIGLPEALEGMPAQQRRALLLREWQGLSYKEIADELDLSQAAVETLLFRARRSLAAGLTEPDAPAGKRTLGKIRAGSDAGSLLTLLQGLFFSGGAKVAVTVATVAATSVVAATPSARHAVEHAVAPVKPQHVAPRAHVTRPAQHRTAAPAARAALVATTRLLGARATSLHAATTANAASARVQRNAAAHRSDGRTPASLARFERTIGRAHSEPAAPALASTPVTPVAPTPATPAEAPPVGQPAPPTPAPVPTANPSPAPTSTPAAPAAPTPQQPVTKDKEKAQDKPRADTTQPAPVAPTAAATKPSDQKPTKVKDHGDKGRGHDPAPAPVESVPSAPPPTPVAPTPPAPPTGQTPTTPAPPSTPPVAVAPTPPSATPTPTPPPAAPTKKTPGLPPAPLESTVTPPAAATPPPATTTPAATPPPAADNQGRQHRDQGDRGSGKGK